MAITTHQDFTHYRSLFLLFCIFGAVSSQNDTLNSTEILQETPLPSLVSLNGTNNSTSSKNESIVELEMPQKVTTNNTSDPQPVTDRVPSVELPPPEVFLQKCRDFKDKRAFASNELILNIPGNLTNSDESVDFGLNNQTTKLNCGRTSIRTLKWENGTKLVKVKSKIKNERLRSSGKLTIHFTHGGYLHFDGHYYQPDEYCIKSVSDAEIEVETCEIKCSDKDKICIPKCCGVDEVLEYWKFTCRKMTPNEIKWFPKLHDPEYPHEVISDAGVLDRVRFKRQHLNCPNFERWPLTKQIGALNKSNYDMGIRWKLSPNRRPVYISDRRLWEHIPEGLYCVDGFANWGYGGNSTYYGDVDSHTVILLCPTSFSFPAFNAAKAWIYSVALLFSSWFLLLTAVVHLLLLEKQHLHGLVVLCHSLSMYFLYVFCAIAHIISLYPEIKGLKERAPFCMCIAVLSHYFFMATFTWLTVMNFDLWLTFRSMRPVSRMSKRIRRFRLYSLIGWGLPGILSATFYTLDEIYRDKLSEVPVPDYAVKNCYVSIESRGYYMYSLVAIALTINTCLVVSTFWIFYEFRKQNANTFVNRKTKSDKYSVRLFIKLFCVMGVAWFVELLSWYYNGDIKPWPVVILDCIMFFQAFAIFFIFCINRRTLKQLEEKYPEMRKYIRPLQAYKWFRSYSDAENVEMTTPGSTPRKLSLSVTTHSRLDSHSTLPRKGSNTSSRSTPASSPVNPNNVAIMEEINLDSDAESGTGESPKKNGNGVQQAPDLITNAKSSLYAPN